ncbi:hypothetical protein A2U01_0102263, partial [Trifolium medium]|nr:hypothetical protein [Trifolium medium]
SCSRVGQATDSKQQNCTASCALRPSAWRLAPRTDNT